MTQSTQPRISIVTPTYNRADYLERTIQSIIGQNYPNLEYIIIDGGSSDATVDIIKQYEQYLAYWVSEPDSGMYHAIQKGLERTTGNIIGWLNSDDMYFDWTFETISSIFNTLPQVEWLTTNQLFAMDEHDNPIFNDQIKGFSREAFYKGEHLPISSQRVKQSYIMQEGTFWKRSLWEKSGSSLDVSLNYAGETDLWFRFFQHANLHEVSIPLARFREHANQITSKDNDKYEAEVEQLYQRYIQHPYTPLTAWLRRFAAKHTPARIRGLALRLGLMHRSHQVALNLRTHNWELKSRYY